MQVKAIGLKVGCLFLIVVGLLLFIALTFSHILIPLVPIIVGVLVLYTTKTQRKLIKTVPTPIYQITEGWVKIVGTVSASKTFVTPYFKQECIAYNYRKADISYDSEDNTERENSAIIEEEFQDFYLTNATGKIKVIVNRLNLALLPAKTDTKHSIKYAVDDIRYTERTLKNGDLISVLGYAVKNSNYGYELTEQDKKILVIATPNIEDKTIKSFRIFKHLTPYLILMYLAVNYFMFFAPVKQHVEKSTAFVLFTFFGMPILGVILGAVGTKFTGFSKDFISGIGGICFIVSLLSFPLLCLLFIANTEFYIIKRVWASIFACTSMAFIITYRKIEGTFDKE
ncbi:hypothetical protein EZ449_09190 [Pedobacter frigidisoli]|uniref:Uncharacterized protein n=1 Tax=Pedobacter frigidisoli TaxID=2530455 RepID=A0A4V2MMY3_9SPHI|nr:hypothetical protein [Pedobacter frigidisoli]TCD10511.1 hypothetical protein EZ449_09190 [Pedobacter frigidisoli]